MEDIERKKDKLNMANRKLLIFPVVAYVTWDQSLLTVHPFLYLLNCFLLHGFMAEMLFCRAGCSWSIMMDLKFGMSDFSESKHPRAVRTKDLLDTSFSNLLR